MRKTLNDNPLMALGVIGVLGLVVAFMLLHSASPRGGSTTSTTAATPTDPSAVASTATGTPATSVPATSAVPAATGGVAPTAAAGDFEAGPGLPKAVVDAYDSGKVVTIVVLKRNGIDDRDLAQATAPLRHSANVALFQTWASKVARYSRVTEGVDLNRVPAIVVIRPKNLTEGPTPQASVDYGFKSIQSVSQAVRDATYKGAENLPSFPR